MKAFLQLDIAAWFSHVGTGEEWSGVGPLVGVRGGQRGPVATSPDCWESLAALEE